MRSLRYLIIKRFKFLVLLSTSIGLSLILLVIRMKINQSFYLLFLVWNMFLAMIPYTITTGLRLLAKPRPFVLFIAFFIWLLFLPNAPYIVTDLLHLRNANLDLMWLDVLVITSFALNGLILFFLSIREMKCILKKYLNPYVVTTLNTLIFGLTAFGIYLGRFLRYNSWEVLYNPLALIKDIFSILFQPNLNVWVFTLTFSAFLWIFYELMDVLSSGKFKDG